MEILNCIIQSVNLVAGIAKAVSNILEARKAYIDVLADKKKDSSTKVPAKDESSVKHEA